MPFLTEAQVRAAKTREKPYKLFDTHGLYLRVELSGGRLWRRAWPGRRCRQLD